MLRTHFNKSQFVVVSLKDGMFNNANVLFKTKFVDGCSTVTRYAQAAVSSPTDKENARGKKPQGKRTKRVGGARQSSSLASN